jgi:hypothetical protein
MHWLKRSIHDSRGGSVNTGNHHVAILLAMAKRRSSAIWLISIMRGFMPDLRDAKLCRRQTITASLEATGAFELEAK